LLGRGGSVRQTVKVELFSSEETLHRSSGRCRRKGVDRRARRHEVRAAIP
jgi:hypothetical protein